MYRKKSFYACMRFFFEQIEKEIFRETAMGTVLFFFIYRSPDVHKSHDQSLMYYNLKIKHSVATLKCKGCSLPLMLG